MSTDTTDRKTITQSVARDLYRAGNDAGRGYSPEGDAGRGYSPSGETIDIAVSEMIAIGGTLILARETSSDVAVVEDSRGELVAIGGDAQGGNAWAVNIGPAR